MAYVDLNPIRAGIAATPEESTFTSIYERIRKAVGPRSVAEAKEEGDPHPHIPLRPFHAEEARETIPYRFEDFTHAA